MDSAGQLMPRSLRRTVATGALVVGGVVGLGSIAGAATDGAGHGAEDMRHESMMNMMSDMEMADDVPMGQMHGEMMSNSADMRRMHAHMMNHHPEMREMHADMVSGGESSSSGCGHGPLA